METPQEGDAGAQLGHLLKCDFAGAGRQHRSVFRSGVRGPIGKNRDRSEGAGLAPLELASRPTWHSSFDGGQVKGHDERSLIVTTAGAVGSSVGSD
jgi:hypothetical protein